MSDPYTDEQSALDNPPQWWVRRFVPAKLNKKAKRRYIREVIQKKGRPRGPHRTFGTCPLCGTGNVQLTKDHIVPKWILKRVPFRTLGIDLRMNDSANMQYICAPCNSYKGGSIDVSTVVGRQYWTALRDAIDNELEQERTKGMDTLF